MKPQALLKTQVASYVFDHLIPEKIVLGLGTGSTVDCLIDILGEKAYQFSAVVSSSVRTTKCLQKYGIDCVCLNDVNQIDLYVDGADEACNLMHLIKGGGGALTQEKILAYQANQFICMIDQSKLVQVLGNFPIPVEVLPIARSFVARKLLELTEGKCRVQWREGFVTDNHCHILDIFNLLIEKPLALENEINQIPGVITNGIFARRRPDLVVCATQNGVQILDSLNL